MTSHIESDGTTVSRRMVVQEVRTDFYGTQTYSTILDIQKVLAEEISSDTGGHDHIWMDVECPTCEAPPHTHCSGDTAERPNWMREEDTYWDKPCAKRVIAGVLNLMEVDND